MNSKNLTTLEVVRLTIAILCLFFFGYFAVADANLDSAAHIKAMKSLIVFPYLVLLYKLCEYDEHVYEDPEDAFPAENAVIFQIISFIALAITIVCIGLCFGWTSKSPLFEVLSKLFLVLGLVLYTLMRARKLIWKKVVC